MSPKPHIVIVGGGFAGLAAALRLEQDASRANINITLIDQNCYHCYHALLYEVATAPIDIPLERIPDLERGVCIRLKSLGNIILRRAIQVVQQRVERVDRQQQKVVLADGTSIHYDRLILALGSVSADFGIPGVYENGKTLKDLPDALRLHHDIADALQRAESGEKQRIVIGGGGVSGVELAGELAHYIRRLQKQKSLGAHMVSVHLIEAAPTLLPGMFPPLQAAAIKRLESLGVHLHLGQPLASVSSTEARLADQSIHPFSIFIWCGGLQGHPLMKTLGAPVNRKAQIEVDAVLRLPQDPKVFVLGDSASVMNVRTHLPLPQTAPVAIAEGLFAAEYILAEQAGQALPKQFQTKTFRIVFPVGGRWALTTDGRDLYSGWLAWTVRKYVDWRYYRSILSFREACQVFFRGGSVYLEND